MRHVWAQIRTGRHPGFEEGARMEGGYRLYIEKTNDLLYVVWPVIALNLDFKSRPGDGATGDEKDGAGTEL